MADTLNNETFYGLLLALSAFFLATFLTPVYTYFAYKYKFWKKQKKETLTGEALPVMTKLHAKKFARHFPTMAGVIGVVTVALVTCVCNLNREQTWLPLVGFIGGSIVGFIDDIINVFGSGKGAAGLRAPVKFAMITVLAIWLGWWFAVKLGWTSIEVPFVGPVEVGAVAMMLIFAFAVVATSNAVNISDGLDGLAGGLAMLAYGAYGIIALFQGQWMLTGFCLTVVGWLLSYIWFNVPPARFMMGDTGSFAIGAGLGVVAMMTNAFFLLPIIGILFVVEAGSSLIQIFWKKVFHKKLLISAPIHHHLEAKGWGEAKIVMRFWVIAGVFAIIGVFLAVQGGIVNQGSHDEPVSSLDSSSSTGALLALRMSNTVRSVTPVSLNSPKEERRVRDDKTINLNKLEDDFGVRRSRIVVLDSPKEGHRMRDSKVNNLDKLEDYLGVRDSRAVVFSDYKEGRRLRDGMVTVLDGFEDGFGTRDGGEMGAGDFGKIVVMESLKDSEGNDA